MLSFFTKRSHWLTALALTGLIASSTFAAKKIFVAITQITSHAALDEVREGIKDKIVKYAQTHQLDLIWVYDNAQGNIATATQIAQKFVGLNPDIIIAISTPSAQTVISATRNSNIPVVFAAVTDPVAAKLVKSLEEPGDRITGTYDFPPIADQIALLEDLDPRVKTIGVLYNPGEVNSVKQLAVLHQVAKAKGLTVVEGPTLKSTEVIPTAQRLLGRVDAIYVPQDNMVVSSLPGVAKLALERGLPLIAPDPEGVKVGALATVGFSHYDEGLASGSIALRILNGEDPSTIPVQQPEDKKNYLNLAALKQLNIELPEKLKKRKWIIY